MRSLIQTQRILHLDRFDSCRPDRRRFVRAMAGGFVGLHLARTTAQGSRLPRVGFLLFNSPSTEPLAALLRKLEDLGFVDGKTISIDYRFAEGKTSVFPNSRWS